MQELQDNYKDGIYVKWEYQKEKKVKTDQNKYLMF